MLLQICIISSGKMISIYGFWLSLKKIVLELIAWAESYFPSPLSFIYQYGSSLDVEIFPFILPVPKMDEPLMLPEISCTGMLQKDINCLSSLIVMVSSTYSILSK